MGQKRGLLANSRVKKTKTSSDSPIIAGSKYLMGRVVDIVLNSEHPKFNEVGGFNGIGTIFYELNNNIGNQKLKAKPFYPQFSTYPLVNELVLLFKLPNSNLGILPSQESYYYINMINVWNSPHHNAYPRPDIGLETLEGFENPSQTTQPELRLNSPNNESQQTFLERDNIAPLIPFPGDTIYEGRWGNSIRFSSTCKTFNNTSYNNWSSKGENGDPIITIRNGQPKGISNGFVPISENINNDQSSIYLTSTQKIPISVSSKDYLSYGVDNENVPTSPEEFEGNQVIINSGRLIFNSINDHIMLSSNKTINLNSKKGIYLDTPNDVVVSTNSKIKLGGQEACESLILGDTLKNDLDFMLSVLIQLVDTISYSQLYPGGLPVPDGATSVVASNCKEALKNIKDNLDNILSKTSKTI